MVFSSYLCNMKKRSNNFSHLSRLSIDRASSTLLSAYEKHYYTDRTKMADVIAANHSLILVLPRFGIPLGFGEQSVQEVCERQGLATDFVLLVFNVYTFDDYLPDEQTLITTDLSYLVPYLKASHRYYLNERLPHIERHLKYITAHAGEPYSNILEKFFEDYGREIRDHFDCEEKFVFPYLQQLCDGSRSVKPREKHFADSHSDLVDRLSDLTQIVYKYLPVDCMVEEINELVFGMLQLSSDLEKHALIEERILLPYIEKMEDDEVNEAGE